MLCVVCEGRLSIYLCTCTYDFYNHPIQLVPFIACFLIFTWGLCMFMFTCGVCVCLGRGWLSRVITQEQPISFAETQILMTKLGWQITEPQGPFCFLPWQQWGDRHRPPCLALSLGSVDGRLVFMLTQQTSYYVSHLPSSPLKYSLWSLTSVSESWFCHPSMPKRIRKK